jgi:hypothetical protein
MALLGSAAASTTTTFNIQFLPEYLVFGSPETANTITGIEVIVRGRPRITINGAALLTTLSKVNIAGVLGTTVAVGRVLQLADGGLGNEQVQINITNGLTAVNVFAFTTKSLNQAVGLVKAATQTIVDGSYSDFVGFDRLIFPATNVSTIDVVFKSGWKETLRPSEIKGLMALQGLSLDTDTLLGTNLIINNTFGQFRSVRVYASGGNVTVLRAGRESLAIS